MRFIGKLFIESGLTLDQLDHLNLSHPRGLNPKYEKPAPLVETKIVFYSFARRPVSRRRRDPCLEASRIRPRARRTRAPRRLAPSARTRRGRVADAKVASVPVWATLLRVVVCCAALL